MSEKICWFINSLESKKYESTTWYRCPGVENFLNKVEAHGNEIVGLIISDNNIGFILDKK